MKTHDASSKDKFEIWLGKHNRKLEFVRTAVAIVGTLLTACVFMKIFEMI